MAKILSGTFLFLVLIGHTVRADAPRLVPVQGHLSDASGAPLEGNVQMLFSLYQTPTGGSAVYFETQEVQVTNGIFSVYLGATGAVDLSLFMQLGEIWLGIQVESDAEMQRVRLGSVPYAGYAEHTRGPTLADLSCTVDQIVKFNGTGWECVDPAGQAALDITIESWSGSGNTFADGVTVACPAGYKRIACSHSCEDGIDDTQSWPVDPESCRGHESNDTNHGLANCHLYATCLRLVP